MSGPKGYGYRVISEEERRRRDEAARQVRCTKLISRIRGLVDTSARLGITYAFPQDIMGHAVFTVEDEQSLLQRADELERAIDDVYRARRICNMKAELAEMIQHCKYPESISPAESYIKAAEAESPNEEAALLQALYCAAHDIKLAEAKGIAEATMRTYDVHSAKHAYELFPPTSKKKPAAEHRFPEKLQVIANAISGIHDDGKREAARERLAYIAGLPDSALVKGELLSLENWIHSVLEGEEWARLAVSEVVRIEHVDSLLADRARALSVDVSTRDGYEELKAVIADALSEYNRTEDAVYVQAALQEALESLGFTMGDPFTVTDYGEVGIAMHPAVPGYGIRIQNNPRSSQILTRVVSYAETESDQDAEAERNSCSVVHSLATSLEDFGVSVELVSEKMPGECRVEHYSDWRSDSRNTGAKRAAPARERMR